MSAMFAKSVLPKYEQKVLDNGLQIVVIPLKNGSGVIETNVFYKVGSRDEVMGKSGLAHMLEHLSFKSTQNLKAGEFDEVVKGLGGVDNASTSFDYTRYFIKSSSEHIDTSLKLFAELMGNLKLLDSEFQSERKVVAEERRWRTDNSPIGYLYFRFFNTAYIYHPYHWTPIGFMEDILSWKIEDIREFYKRFYQPSNAIVLVAGDIEPKVVFESAKKHFGKIAESKASKAPKDSGAKASSTSMSPAPEPAQDGYREVIINKDTQIEWLMMGYKIPNFEHKDQIALSALADVLSGGKSSILESELVDKKQLASEVSAYPMAMKDSGVFVFIAGGNEGVQAKTLQKEIGEVIERLRAKPIAQSELDKIKLNIRAGFLSALEKSSSVAGLFGSYLVRGNIEPLLRYEEELEKLTPKDIQEVAQKYFNENTLSVAILKDEPKAKTAAKTAAKVK
ncbi:peptidase M16 [Helicobacter sp. CLO-3]|uniref:M16 family metallopeptidase n=1 Tax=unclassified Helicobacter TaxID=2593540 RepID=UPI000804F3BD|nr:MULTISPECIES: pitrilysin family protein [unclassified Helicobacter]OBV29231.1 protease [Helicobacter sp. CLO-3]OHU84450.1 peptidase M16 [Helicobacter sp. CLO-3]